MDVAAPADAPRESAAKRRQRRATVVDVRLRTAEDGALELSAHKLAPQIALFMPHVFPAFRGREKELHVVVTAQRARIDIMDITRETEAERLRLFRTFATFADGLCHELEQGEGEGGEGEGGALADYSDMDGSAVRHAKGPSAFNDVEVVHSALGCEWPNRRSS